MFESIAKSIRIPCVRVARKPAENYQITPRLVRAAKSQGATLLCLTDPHNPTGAQTDIETLLLSVQQADRHGIQVIVDRVFADFAADPTQYTIEGLERPILARSFSKSLGVGHYRFGWLVAPEADAEAIEDAIDVTQGQPLSNHFSGQIASQLAGKYSFEIHTARDIVHVNRQKLLHSMEPIAKLAIANAQSQVPFALVSVLTKGRDFVTELTQKHSVAVVPGPLLGFDRQSFRIGLGGSPSQLEHALDIVERLLRQ